MVLAQDITCKFISSCVYGSCITFQAFLQVINPENLVFCAEGYRIAWVLYRSDMKNRSKFLIPFKKPWALVSILAGIGQGWKNLFVLGWSEIFTDFELRLL